MRRALGALWIVALVAPLVLASALQAKEVPYLSARVNDLADLFPAGAEERLEARLRAFEERTGAQMAVLTVASLEGDPLEDFSLRVAETWKLGDAERDDGLLLLIVRDERSMRLEVGYGLEPRITDAHSRRILDNVLRPAFRQGDFAGGVERAVDIAEELAGGADVAIEPPPSPRRKLSGEDLVSALIMIILVCSFGMQAVMAGRALSLILLTVMGPLAYLVLSQFLGGTLGQGLGVLWNVLYLLLYAFLWFTDSGAETRKRWRSRSSSGGGDGGWISSGGGFSGGFSGGGFSGGGFSGGGGSFGGGGASGSW